MQQILVASGAAACDTKYTTGKKKNPGNFRITPMGRIKSVQMHITIDAKIVLMNKCDWRAGSRRAITGQPCATSDPHRSWHLPSCTRTQPLPHPLESYAFAPQYGTLPTNTGSEYLYAAYIHAMCARVFGVALLDDISRGISAHCHIVCVRYLCVHVLRLSMASQYIAKHKSILFF